MVKLVALFAGVVLAVAACGGGSADDEETAKKNIASSIKEGGSGNAPLSADDADCFSDRVVDKLGTDKLKRYGILDDDLEVKKGLDVKLSEGDADKAADAVVECVDLDEYLEESVGAAGGRRIVDCLKDAIDEKLFHDVVAAVFAGDPDASSKLMEPATKCAGGAAP